MPLARGRGSAAVRMLMLLPIVGLAAACGGGGSTPTPIVSQKPVALPPPDIAAFLRNPVATPSACPARQPASASGLGSPWVGHVDISVFLKDSASTKQIAQVGDQLRKAAGVSKVYFESKAEAFEEFKRLYTCWSAYSDADTPASYRVALKPTTRIDARNALVARFAAMHTVVDTVSCDPSLPCVNAVRSAAPGS